MQHQRHVLSILGSVWEDSRVEGWDGRIGTQVHLSRTVASPWLWSWSWLMTLPSLEFVHIRYLQETRQHATWFSSLCPFSFVPPFLLLPFLSPHSPLRQGLKYPGWLLTYYIVEDDLELLNLLLLLPECWDCRCTSPCLVFNAVLEVKPGPLCMPGKHSMGWAIAPAPRISS